MNAELVKMNSIMKELLFKEGCNMSEALREKMCALGLEIEKTVERSVEVEIWIEDGKLERFTTDFEGMNTVKYEGSEVIKIMGVDKRISLFYKVFGTEELKYPEQGYYQLNAVYE